MNTVVKDGFTSQRLVRSVEIRLNGTIEEVFPLFGALREKVWAAGWDPQVLYTECGDIEEYMVFRTTSVHGPAEGPYTWVVSKYRPEEALVEYTIFTPQRVWWIEITCRAGQAAGETIARVTYTFNGLSEHGNHLSLAAADRMFAEDLLDWERAINAVLIPGSNG